MSTTQSLCDRGNPSCPEKLKKKKVIIQHTGPFKILSTGQEFKKITNKVIQENNFQNSINK